MAKKHYVIRGGIKGRERLRVIARVMRPFTTGLLDRVGIDLGSRILDVGCGGGDVTLVLGRKTGTAGSVLGLDMDETKLALAREEAAREGIANVTFRQADITRLADESTYDVVYARFLLSHLPDPAGVLVKLISMLRPGGLLIVEDVDHSGCVCAPEVAAYRHYQRLYRLLAARRGVDADIGPRLPHLLTEAGFSQVELHIVQPAALQGEAKLGMAITLENIAEAVLAEGLMEPRELETTIKDLYEVARDTTTLMAFPRIFQSWGRRPIA